VRAGAKNQGFMVVECAHSCRTCHMRDPAVRCKRNASEPQMLQPSQMGAMFKRLQAGELGAEYGPVTVHSTDPWVVTFDHFLSPEEADAIVALVDESEYKRSSNVGGVTETGRFKQQLDESRTSLNTWCDDKCSEAAVVVELHERVEAITGIPPANAEYM
jgi:hypothetical protein